MTRVTISKAFNGVLAGADLGGYLIDNSAFWLVPILGLPRVLIRALLTLPSLVQLA